MIFSVGWPLVNWFLTALTFMRMWNSIHGALWFYITRCLRNNTQCHCTLGIARLVLLDSVLSPQDRSWHLWFTILLGHDIYHITWFWYLPYYLVFISTILLGLDIHHITWSGLIWVSTSTAHNSAYFLHVQSWKELPSKCTADISIPLDHILVQL